MWNNWNGQILFRRSRGKGNGSLNVIRFEAGKIGKNFLDGSSIGEAGKHSAQGHSRALKDRLAAANSGITNDAVLVAFRIARCAAHVFAFDFSQSIISLQAVFLPYFMP